MIIDTHTHLYSSQFDDDRTEMIQRAIAAGVEVLCLPNIDLESIPGMHALETQFPNHCHAMMGLHPCSVDENWEATFEVIDQENDERLSGIFHCFTGTADDAKRIDNYGGFLLGIGGVVTYKKSDLPEVLKTVSPEKLVLETDAPYLPPVPFRGKRNESAYVLHTAEKVAEIYEMPLRQLTDLTTKNAIELFGLQQAVANLGK